jgi:hypothetical protein
MGPYLASSTLLKGLTIGPDYLVHVGGAPLIMTTIAAWLSAMAIRFLPALPNLVTAAILYFAGAALHNAAMADYGRVTLDPFILAFLLKISAIALLIASITALFRYRKTTLHPPPDPEPLCPPIPPLP